MLSRLIPTLSSIWQMQNTDRYLSITFKSKRQVINFKSTRYLSLSLATLLKCQTSWTLSATFCLSRNYDSDFKPAHHETLICIFECFYVHICRYSGLGNWFFLYFILYYSDRIFINYFVRMYSRCKSSVWEYILLWIFLWNSNTQTRKLCLVIY